LAVRAASSRGLYPMKGKQLKASASHSKAKSKARTKSRHTLKPRARRTADRKTNRQTHRKADRRTDRKTAATARPARTEVTRARATTPARATHGGAVATPARRVPIPSPLPTRHVAPVRAALALPARSMPPAAKEQKRPSPTAAATKPTVVLP
jgi:hypothetical protein